MGKWWNWDYQLKTVHSHSQSHWYCFIHQWLCWSYFHTLRALIQTSLQWTIDGTKRESRLIRSAGFFEVFVCEAAAPFAVIFEAAGTSSGQGSPAAPALPQQPLGSCVGMNRPELPLARAAQFVCRCNSTWEFNHSLIKSVRYQQHTFPPLQGCL